MVSTGQFFAKYFIFCTEHPGYAGGGAAAAATCTRAVPFELLRQLARELKAEVLTELQ